MEDNNLSLKERFRVFRQELPAKIDKMLEHAQKVCDQPDNDFNWQTLIQQAHALAGAAGSYGFSKVSQYSLELEEC